MLRGSDDYDCCFVLPRKESEWRVEAAGDIELRESSVASPAGRPAASAVESATYVAPDEKTMFVALCQRLTASGLAYASYLSVQGDEVYVKVRIPEARLETQADIRDFKLRLDAAALAATLARGLPQAGIQPITLGTHCDGEAVSRIGPHDHIYGKYDTHPDLKHLYAVPANCATPFRSMHRLKLIADVLASDRRFGGCGLVAVRRSFSSISSARTPKPQVLPKRIMDGEILAFLPLHDARERSALFRNWVKAPWRVRLRPSGAAAVADSRPRRYLAPNRLPFAQYKDYFGEQATLYMVWKAHVTQFEVALAGVGIAVEAGVRTFGYGSSGAHWCHAGFAFVVCVWSSALLVCWRRREKRVALEWGMSDFESDEPDRPQFKGTMCNSPKDGSPEIYFLPRKRDGPRLVGLVVSAAMIALVVAFMLAMQLFKHQRAFSEAYTTLPATLCNAAGIQIFTYAYSTVAIKLTERENWRTETAYSDELIKRLFVFNCINSYGSLYFIGFAQERIPSDWGLGRAWHCVEGPSGAPDCLYDLGYNNMFIMIISLVTSVITSTIVPLVSRKLNEAARRRPFFLSSRRGSRASVVAARAERREAHVGGRVAVPPRRVRRDARQHQRVPRRRFFISRGTRTNPDPTGTRRARSPTATSSSSRSRRRSRSRSAPS